MTRDELRSMAHKKCQELIEAGWDYDDARFATMALANNVLGNDNTPAHDWQANLQREFAKLEPLIPAEVDNSATLPDHDRDTSINGIE